MTTRADHILEGFKLGDLGAGKNRFVKRHEDNVEVELDPVVPGKLKIIHETTKADAVGPSLIWKDSDGLLYMVELFEKRKLSWCIQFSCGTPKSPEDEAAEEDWFAHSPSMKKGKAVEQCEKYIETARKFGIDGILKKYKFNDITPVLGGGGPGKFSKWFENKKQSGVV